MDPKHPDPKLETTKNVFPPDKDNRTDKEIQADKEFRLGRDIRSDRGTDKLTANTGAETPEELQERLKKEQEQKENNVDGRVYTPVR